MSGPLKNRRDHRNLQPPILQMVTLAQQIKLTEEQVKTAQEALQLARERYRLGLGSIVEVTLAYAAGLTASSGAESVSP